MNRRRTRWRWCWRAEVEAMLYVVGLALLVHAAGCREQRQHPEASHPPVQVPAHQVDGQVPTGLAAEADSSWMVPAVDMPWLVATQALADLNDGPVVRRLDVAIRSLLLQYPADPDLVRFQGYLQRMQAHQEHLQRLAVGASPPEYALQGVHELSVFGSAVKCQLLLTWELPVWLGAHRRPQ